MNALVDAARALVMYDGRSPALLIRRPDGRYHVSSNGNGYDLDNVYVISRSQISDLMYTAGMARSTLAETAVAERMASLVNTVHLQRIGATS